MTSLDTQHPNAGKIHPYTGNDMHLGRSWGGSALEDDCPCLKAPCGLVLWSGIDRDCREHGEQFAKTMRQVHAEDNCAVMRETILAEKEHRVCAGCGEAIEGAGTLCAGCAQA